MRSCLIINMLFSLLCNFFFNFAPRKYQFCVAIDTTTGKWRLQWSCQLSSTSRRSQMYVCTESKEQLKCATCSSIIKVCYHVARMPNSNYWDACWLVLPQHVTPPACDSPSIWLPQHMTPPAYDSPALVAYVHIFVPRLCCYRWFPNVN